MVVPKVFKMCLLQKYVFLQSSNPKFGFKTNSGCANAIFCLISATEYANNNGSTRSPWDLNIVKAFDNTNHYVFYIELIKRDIPTFFIIILMNWYDKCWFSVRWGNAISKKFKVIDGIHQVGVISSILFTIFMDVLIKHLKLTKFGCAINGVYFGCILYADDIELLSTSLSALQSMLIICKSFTEAMNIKYNCKKCMVIRIGLHSKYN